MKSIGRYINAKTSDAYKQECINYLLGNCKEGLDSMYFEDNITNVINESKYCTYNDFTAYVLTWNCNNVEPSKLSVKDREKLFAFNPDNVDVLIVCLQ